MTMKNRVFLVGNIKEDGSKSMQVYLDNVRKNLGNPPHLAPSTTIKPSIYKLFFYPFKIPKGYGVYHILDHSYANLVFCLPKQRTIATCHDLIPLKFPNKISFFGKLLFKLYMRGLKRCRMVIADSESTRTDLIELLEISPNRIKTIPLGAGVSNFKRINKRAAQKKWNLNPTDITILSIGEFFYKNTLLTLRAICRLNIQGYKTRLIKIGKFTPQEEKFITDNNLETQIVRKNNLSQEELNLAYCASDLLSFPSLYEGFGLPPLEAMACGTPVIVSNTSSLPEVVGDAAIKINPSSVAELEKAILKLSLNMSFRKNLIKNGYKNLKRFSWKEYAKQLKEIYAKI